MDRKDDEKLWDLLGHSAGREISPFFARNVLREIRQAESEPARHRGWGLQWLVPVAGVAVVIIAGLAIPTQIANRHQSDSPSEEVVFAEGQDGDLIADLDELVESEDSMALDDSVLL